MHRIARSKLLPAFAALVVALPCARALAEDVADPVDPIEDKALKEEAQAKFEEALATFRQAFDACVQQAKGGGEVRERNLARAEVILEKIDALSERVTKRAESEKFLAGYDAEALGPVLESQVRFERARGLLAGGDREGALKLVEPLGLVRHFWLLGPFDNERGRGFKTKEGPEDKVDLDGKYKGKEREVAWREFQADQTLGFVDLDSMLRPNDQAAAYAVAFVKAEKDADAAIRLGSDEAVRAWWNGLEVVSRDVRRPMGFDQDVAGIKLGAGWNILLLKIHDQTGAWGFRVRLTAADGSPLQGVTFATTREQADEALKEKRAGEKLEAPVAGGAKQFYDSVVGKGGEGGARDLFHLGYLHYRRGFDSIADRKAENLLLKASDAEPANAIYRFHYAEAAAPPVELAVEKEENRQRAGREKAIEIDPSYAVAYRALAGYYTTSLVNFERAEQLLRKALEANADFWQARLDLAGVLEKRGLAPQAKIEREKALASAKAAGVEEAARAAAGDADRKGMGTYAADAWREVLKLDATANDARRRVAELAQRALDPKSAVSVLDEMVAWNPYDTGARVRKAEILEGAGDYAAAQDALKSALAIAPEDDGILSALGRVQSKAGQDKEALATFREALRVNPKLQALERYVEFLDPEAAPFEDEFKIDIAPLVAKAKEYANPENDGWIVLLDQTVTKVNRDGTSANYTHTTAKILNDAGVKRFDQYYARGWGSSFKWKVARVLKPDGSVVEAKTSIQQHMADFPPLEKGDVVDLEFRTDDREQSVFGDYFGETMFFADQVPMLVSEWTLLTPAERTFYFNQRHMDVKPSESLRDEGKTRAYTWRREDIAKIRVEPSMPDFREIAAQVQVTTYKDWNEFAKWWGALIRDQSNIHDEMRAKVKELTDGKEARMDKIRAIYEFVTGDITYQAWPFGPHGYKPYTATAIFDKKEGDCKDKAILFNAMLKEIGIEAYPVLIYADDTRSDEDLTLAQVGHFNHCIAYVPDTDGNGKGMFFDGTAEYASAFAPPGMDQGAKVLVVKPEGVELMTVPCSEPQMMGLAQKWDVKVKDDGSATATCEMSWRGDLSIQMRESFSVEGQRQEHLQRMLTGAIGKLKITDMKFEDLKDLSKPEANFRVTLEIEKFVKVSGDARTLPTGFVDFAGQFIRFFIARPKREHDLMLPTSLRGFRTEVAYELPAGWSVVAPPQDAAIDLPVASYTSTAKTDGSKLHLVREMSLKAPRVKTSEYPAFREAATKVLAIAQQQWKVKAGDTPSPEGPAKPAGDAPAVPSNDGGK
jgi:Tfp pilus assembly protein PilF